MLLDAAAELAAEVGAGAVTHRAVAARAGVPLSTTSYFFDSIDDLVTEALRQVVHERVATFDAAERAFVLADAELDDALGAAVDAILAQRSGEGGQAEAFLAAGRNPELQAEVSSIVNRYGARVAWQLRRIGAARPDDVAWAIVALLDGAMLQRLAGVEADHRAGLLRGLRSLLAAAALTDAEVDEVLGRYGGQADLTTGPMAAGAVPAPG